MYPRRHITGGPTQIDRFGQANISALGGTYEQPKVQMLGVRGFPGNSIHHPNSFFVPNHGPRVFCEKVDMVSGVGYDPTAWGSGMKRDFVDLRLVVTNLAVLDFGGPENAMRLCNVHRGVGVDDVKAATGFELDVAADCGETPAPTEEQLRIIREVIDPNDLRATVFPS